MSNPNTGGVDKGTLPSSAASGTGEARSVEDRSFDPGAGQEPGHVPEGHEGGGTMSGRGAESGPGWSDQDARDMAEARRPQGGVGGGGVAGAGTGGGGMGGDSQTAESPGLGGDAGMGRGGSSGGGVTGAMTAGDAAERSADVGGSAGADIPDDPTRRRRPDNDA